MRVTHLARREMEAQNLLPRQQAARLLGPATVARWQGVLRELLRRPVAERALDTVQPAMPSTTQISVMDEDGLVVSLTTSGGEGAGFIVPGTGVILNNMLGEADLHPQGFHKSPPGQRIPSMMAPTVVLRDGQPALALGSGGANRIRSAIVQVLLNGLAGQMSLAQAVAAPRIHFEEGVMQVEAGHDPAAIDALAMTDHRLPITVPCSLCPALAANRRRIVHGYGDAGARVLLVGEAPGYLGADRTGVPFTGDRSGRAGAVAGERPGRGGAAAAGRLHQQRGALQPAWQPQPDAGRSGQLHALPAPGAGGVAARSSRHPGQLRRSLGVSGPAARRHARRHP